MSKVLPTSIREGSFFLNPRKLQIMVGVNAMKNIVMERILVDRTFDIRAILAIFRYFTLFQGHKQFLTTKKSKKISKFWQYCPDIKGSTYKYRVRVNFFSNSSKLKITVVVKVFAMKNIVMKQILVGRTFDI